MARHAELGEGTLDRALIVMEVYQLGEATADRYGSPTQAEGTIWSCAAIATRGLRGANLELRALVRV